MSLLHSNLINCSQTKYLKTIPYTAAHTRMVDISQSSRATKCLIQASIRISNANIRFLHISMVVKIYSRGLKERDILLLVVIWYYWFNMMLFVYGLMYRSNRDIPGHIPCIWLFDESRVGIWHPRALSVVDIHVKIRNSILYRGGNEQFASRVCG